MKPKCKLIGEDGNIFNLMGIAAATLRKAGNAQEARELISRVTTCASYTEALSVIGEYVDIY